MKSSSCARRGGGPCEKGERAETRDDARMGNRRKVTRGVARAKREEEGASERRWTSAALAVGTCGGTARGGKDVVRSKASGAPKGRTRPVPSPANSHSAAPLPSHAQTTFNARHVHIT